MGVSVALPPEARLYDPPDGSDEWSMASYKAETITVDTWSYSGRVALHLEGAKGSVSLLTRIIQVGANEEPPFDV
jgi:hypothetical protein